ncbi:DUF5777 family beta-barrel protein [Mangrovibacterium sp.]|uniref:DUF5777 family beta-barrel protein n=1 Tax=Mangrovibacterium sp. TaxID=1961364 RepID=UPI00356AFE1C
MKKIILYMIFLVPFASTGQDLDELLDAETSVGKIYESAAFKATRVINGHSVEQMKAKHLDFRISHRFGELNGGAYEFFGLDQATIHLSLEYGLKDWLMVGVGRSNLLKTYDGFVKLKLLRQTAGSNSVPIFLSYMGSTEIFTTKWTNLERDNLFSSRLTYVHQLLIARKFNDQLSLQLSPTLVHKNLTPTTRDDNDLYALGASGRYKISNRVAINAEYFYAFRSDDASVDYPNSLSFGVDIETGGHVFQLMLTNSLAMREGGFIWGQDNHNWDDGGIHFGFNVSRVFSFDKKNRSY